MIRIEKILHPSDFSDNSNHAQKYACAFAKHFGAELHVIHVISDPAVVAIPPTEGYLPKSYYEDIRQRTNEELSQLPDKEWGEGITVVREAMDGIAFIEIARYAKDKSIDLIVMGTHGYTGLTHLVMGSVAEKVVRKAPCPVLTVHPEDHEFVLP